MQAERLPGLRGKTLAVLDEPGLKWAGELDPAFPVLLPIRCHGTRPGAFPVMERAGAAVGPTRCPKTRG